MPSRGLFNALVVANTKLCAEHYRLTLHVAGFPECVPGQFVQLECRDPESAEADKGHMPDAAECNPPPREFDWPPASGSGRPQVMDADMLSAVAYLRRPFSIAGVPRVGQIEIIHRVVGRGTRYLETLCPGDEISVLGPLGRGFAVPEEMTTALLVGGGVGIPPMLFLADRLAQQGKKGIAFVGAQRRELIPLTLGNVVPAADGLPVMSVDEFARHGMPTVLTTDDGSLGMKGFVTQGLDAFLAGAERAGMVVFCCGPTPMMKATAKVAAKHGVRCFVSLEQPMACGMGTCQSCVVKVKNGEDWSYRLTCTDGPVFETHSLMW